MGAGATARTFATAAAARGDDGQPVPSRAAELLADAAATAQLIPAEHPGTSAVPAANLAAKAITARAAASVPAAAAVAANSDDVPFEPLRCYPLLLCEGLFGPTSPCWTNA